MSEKKIYKSSDLILGIFASFLGLFYIYIIFQNEELSDLVGISNYSIIFILSHLMILSVGRVYYFLAKHSSVVEYRDQLTDLINTKSNLVSKKVDLFSLKKEPEKANEALNEHQKAIDEYGKDSEAATRLIIDREKRLNKAVKLCCTISALTIIVLFVSYFYDISSLPHQLCQWSHS